MHLFIRDTTLEILNIKTIMAFKIKTSPTGHNKCYFLINLVHIGLTVSISFSQPQGDMQGEQGLSASIDMG